MKYTPKFLRVTATLMTLACLTAQAEVLVNYDFTNEVDPSLPTVVATNASAGNIATFGLSTGISTSFENIYSNTLRVERTEATSLTGSVHFDFTITATSGYLLNLESLTFNYGGINSQASDFTLNYTVQTSAEGIGGSDPIAGSGSQVLAPSAGQNLYPHTVTLSGTDYEGLSSVSFRFNPWSTETTNNSIRLANITVNGTVSAIPEPSTFGMIAGLLATLGAYLWRRNSTKPNRDA